MKGRRVAGTVLIAGFGALVALFIYTRFLDDRFNLAERGNSLNRPVQFTNSFNAPAGGAIDFSDMAEQIVHTVVHVKTKSFQEYSYRNPIMEFFYGESNNQKREVQGFGSGVIISEDGYIITNNHVIEGADVVDVTLNDKHTLSADVVGRDVTTDIALLKVDSEGLPFIRIGDSDELRLGQWVVAIGNPFNLTSTVTAGIVSAKGRSLELLDSQYRIESFIQTDAALNMGNSGGALVNIKGELVGITTAIISPTKTYAGNSFAVPVNIVSKVAEDLKVYGEVQRAIIGVNITDITSEYADEQKLEEVKGVLITNIREGGAAQDAGLKEGDIITSFDGIETDTRAELQEEIGKRRPGETVQLIVLRNNKEKVYNLTLKNLEGGTDIVRAGVGSGIIYGASMEPLSPEEKDRFNLGSGLIITSIEEGRLSDIGIRRGYIITEVNGQDVNSIKEIRDVTDEGVDLISLKGIQSNGTIFSYRFK